MNSPIKTPNPKDAIGVKKTPFSVLSWPVIAETALAFLEGAIKYGRHNYRVAPVRASVYYDGAQRHMSRWWDMGEEFDPDVPNGARIHHTTKAIACLSIIRDAMIHGTLIDDRPPSSPEWLLDFNEQARKLVDSRPDPVAAFTIKDTRAPEVAKANPSIAELMQELQGNEDALRHREEARAALLQFAHLTRDLERVGRGTEAGLALVPRLRASQDVILNMVAGLFPAFEDEKFPEPVSHVVLGAEGFADYPERGRHSPSVPNPRDIDDVGIIG